MLLAFQEDYNLKKDARLPIQEISTTNTITYKNKIFSLEGTVSIDIFTAGATYMHDGVEKEVPRHMMSVSEKRSKDEVMKVYKNLSGDVDYITIMQRISGTVVEFKAMHPNVFVTIEQDDYDYDGIDAKYSFAEMENQDHRYRANSSSQDIGPAPQMAAACSKFRQIDLAIAYESSFCSQNGGTSGSSDLVVRNVVSEASSMYEQDDLCIVIKIVHLEGYCNPNSDPYVDIVNLNQSGCSNEGILDGFQDLWIATRRGIARDVAHLFSGTPLECSNGNCKIGCAYEGGICTTDLGEFDIGFAAHYLTFTQSANLRATAVAHELGHNCGATHISGNDVANHIMVADFQGNSVFHERTIKMMKDVLDEKNCVGTADLNNQPNNCKQKLLRAAIKGVESRLGI